MASAIEMMRSGQLPRPKAAAMYSVPKSTLCDKLNGRTPEDHVRPAPQTVLTTSEENVLVDYCKLTVTIGYPINQQEMLKGVKRVLDLDGRNTHFKDNLPCNDRFYILYFFKRRHPEFTERLAMGLGHQSASITDALIEGWHSGLRTILKRKSLNLLT